MDYSAFKKNKQISTQSGNEVYQLMNGKPSFALKPKQDTSTISAYQEPESPIGFVGDMIKGAYRGVKGLVEGAVNSLDRLTESMGEYHIKDYQKLSLNTQPGQTYDETAKRLGIKKVKPLERAVNLATAGVQTGAALLPAFQIFVAELEAAKNLPGPTKIPALIFSKTIEKMGQYGSLAINKGIDGLQISDDSKEVMRPIADEIAPLVSMIVGMKLVHGGMEKGISKVAGKKVAGGVNFGMQLSVQPFSTVYGLVGSRVAQKVGERQQQGIEVNPQESNKIMKELKQEIQEQGLPDIDKNGEIKPEKSKEAYKPIIEQKTLVAKPETAKKGIIKSIITNKTDKISKILKNSILNDKKGIRLKSIDIAKKNIKEGKPLFIEIRKLENGDWFIDDGRHRLEAARQLGIKNIEIKDVTKNYLKPKREIKPIKNKVKFNVEPKAIEKNLTKGKKPTKFENRTFKEESKKVADLINNDIKKARAIVRGEEPTDIRAGAIIGGMEEYAKKHPSEAGDIIQELANSPLEVTISTGASETSFARMRETAAKQLNEVKKTYEKKVRNYKKKKTKLKKSLKEETKKFNLSKEERSLKNFLDKIVC